MSNEPSQISGQETAQAQAAIQHALRSPLPRIYANSFINVLSDADVMSVLQSNGQNVALLNMSYVVAKAFGAALAEACKNYEDKFKTKLPDPELATTIPSTDVRKS